jgi:hypothetical protein
MLGFADFFPFAGRRSLFTVIPAVLILSLVFSCPCNAMRAIPAPVPVQRGKSAATRPVASLPPAVQRSVENVFIDKIEDGAIYSRDGRKFETGGAKVIDNSHKATGRKAAELFFENGDLVEVILK